jgi:hypothetical protein
MYSRYLYTVFFLTLTLHGKHPDLIQIRVHAHKLGNRRAFRLLRQIGHQNNKKV